MSKLVNGILEDKRITQKRYESLHKGKMGQVKAIVVHQTGASSVESTFNSYASSAHGAHFLVDKAGKIYQTALATRVCYHVGKIRSRCLEAKACTQEEVSAANAIYLKKGLSYSVRIGNLHRHEKKKNYPERYPTNRDSIGIEVVGNYDIRTQSYEPVNAKQNAALKWLVSELSKHLSLQKDDIFKHPEVSYKQPSEASTASW